MKEAEAESKIVVPGREHDKNRIEKPKTAAIKLENLNEEEIERIAIFRLR